MAKYKLKSLSVGIGGKVYRKKDCEIFDTDGKFKSLKQDVEVAFKAGFLEKLSEKEAAKAAKVAEIEAAKVVEIEAAKAAEIEAAKAAEKEAAKAKKAAEKEAEKKKK